MKDNLTQIIFLLDRSGSMRSLTSDTIGGYNSFIQSQKETTDEALLTTILFDHKYEVLHNSVDIKVVNDITEKEYYTRGMTALYDAIGMAIEDTGRELREMQEENRPSKVIMVITTDGYENSSKEFTHDDIREMIEHQQNKYNWEFIFLGANIDAMEVASGFGINLSSNYESSGVGLDSMFSSLSKTVNEYRATGTIDENWSNDIIK